MTGWQHQHLGDDQNQRAHCMTLARVFNLREGLTAMMTACPTA
jgi:hypothetical protein